MRTLALGEIDDLSAAFYMNSLQAHYKLLDKGDEDNVASSCDVHAQNNTKHSSPQHSLRVLFNPFKQLLPDHWI